MKLENINAKDGINLMKIVYYSLMASYNTRLTESRDHNITFNTFYDFAKNFNTLSKEEQYFYLSAGFLLTYEDMGVFDFIIKYLPIDELGLITIGDKVIDKKTNLTVYEIKKIFDILWETHLSLLNIDNFFFHLKE